MMNGLSFKILKSSAFIAIGLFSIATTHIIKEGETEVGRWVEEDGKNEILIVQSDLTSGQTKISNPVSNTGIVAGSQTEPSAQKDGADPVDLEAPLLAGSGSLTKQFLEAKIKASGDIPEKSRDQVLREEKARVQAASLPQNVQNYLDHWEWSIEGEIRTLGWFVAALGGKSSDPAETLRMMRNYKVPAIVLEKFQAIKAPAELMPIHEKLLVLLSEHVQLMKLYDQGDFQNTKIQAEALHQKYKTLQGKYKAFRALQINS